jgi:Virulence activator alpha C-term
VRAPNAVSRRSSNSSCVRYPSAAASPSRATVASRSASLARTCGSVASKPGSRRVRAGRRSFENGKGHVEPGQLGPRESRPFRVTDTGRATYRSWLTEHLPTETVRIPLLLAVAFGSVLPRDKVRALLLESEAEHRKRLAHYHELDDHLARLGVDAWSRATLSFGLHYEQAVVCIGSSHYRVRSLARQRAANTRPFRWVVGRRFVLLPREGGW